jgi:hypothetical protein
LASYKNGNYAINKYIIRIPTGNTKGEPLSTACPFLNF